MFGAPVDELYKDDPDRVWRLALGIFFVAAGGLTFLLAGPAKPSPFHGMHSVESARIVAIADYRTRMGAVFTLTLDTTRTTAPSATLLELNVPASATARSNLRALREGDRVNAVYDLFNNRVWRVETLTNGWPVTIISPELIAEWGQRERTIARQRSVMLLIAALGLIVWFAADQLVRRRAGRN